jgi:hypothetical protein
MNARAVLDTDWPAERRVIGYVDELDFSPHRVCVYCNRHEGPGADECGCEHDFALTGRGELRGTVHIEGQVGPDVGLAFTLLEGLAL